MPSDPDAGSGSDTDLAGMSLESQPEEEGSRVVPAGLAPPPLSSSNNGGSTKRKRKKKRKEGAASAADDLVVHDLEFEGQEGDDGKEA